MSRPKFPDFADLHAYIKSTKADIGGIPKYRRSAPYKMHFPYITIATVVYSPLGLSLAAGGRNSETNKSWRGLFATFQSHKTILSKTYKNYLPSIKKAKSNAFATSVAHDTKRQIDKLIKNLNYQYKHAAKNYGYLESTNRLDLCEKLSIIEPLKEIYIGSENLSPLTGALIEAIAIADKICLMHMSAVRSKKCDRESFKAYRNDIQKEFDQIYAKIAIGSKTMPNITFSTFTFMEKKQTLQSIDIEKKSLEKTFGGLERVSQHNKGSAPLYF